MNIPLNNVVLTTQIQRLHQIAVRNHKFVDYSWCIWFHNEWTKATKTVQEGLKHVKRN